jgi:transposase
MVSSNRSRLSIVALTTIAREDGRERPYAAAIDDPARFQSSKQAGAHFGLTPRKYQSGETDYSGRISKIGDAAVREAFYQAAHVMLTKPVKGCTDLKSLSDAEARMSAATCGGLW